MNKNEQNKNNNLDPQVKEIILLWMEQNKPGQKNCFDFVVSSDAIGKKILHATGELISIATIATFLQEKGYIQAWNGDDFGWLVLN
jgi:superfamily II helicase